MSATRSSHFDARLLASDAEVAFLLADDARRRVLMRTLGVRKDEPSLLVTIIALGVLADAIHNKAGQMRPAHPSAADAVLGTTLINEGLHRVAGDWSRHAPRFGTLVAIAVLGARLGPALRTSLHRAGASGRRARARWGHRYGYLIGAGPRSGARPGSA